MPDTKPDYLVMIDKRTCPRAADHDPEVEYGIPERLTFSEWARAKAQTHRPVKCQGCGLFRIWEPIPAEWVEMRAAMAEEADPAAPRNTAGYS